MVCTTANVGNLTYIQDRDKIETNTQLVTFVKTNKSFILELLRGKPHAELPAVYSALHEALTISCDSCRVVKTTIEDCNTFPAEANDLQLFRP